MTVSMLVATTFLMVVFKEIVKAALKTSTKTVRRFRKRRREARLPLTLNRTHRRRMSTNRTVQLTGALKHLER